MIRAGRGDIPYPFVSATATGPDDAMRTSEFAYTEEVVPAPMTISGFVWDDGWAQPYINLYYDGNGIQDPGSEGIGNLTVLLYDDRGNLVASTTTSMYPSPTQGNYSFDVEPGTYRVQFSLPEGDELTRYNFSPKDAGPDDVDSDAYVDTGFTDFVTLDLGDSADFDAGVFAIHDTVPGGGGP